MKKFIFAWMLLVASLSNGADLAEADRDAIRGLSNHALCEQLQPGSKSNDLLREVKVRGLICNSLDEEGWDYTPDAHATSPSASGTTEETSGINIGQTTLESTSPPIVGIPVTKPTPIEESVIRVSSGNTVGSGFYIDATHIVTNAHVVGHASQVTLARSNGSPFVGRVLFQNMDVDFAIIDTDIPGSPIAVRHNPITEGDGVMALGYPQGRMTVAASTGTIRKIMPCCIIHDALIAAGSSGGPLVDGNREALGLNTLISKVPSDRANATDRGVTLRMDYVIERLMGSLTEMATHQSKIPDLP